MTGNVHYLSHTRCIQALLTCVDSSCQISEDELKTGQSISGNTCGPENETHSWSDTGDGRTGDSVQRESQPGRTASWRCLVQHLSIIWFSIMGNSIRSHRRQWSVKHWLSAWRGQRRDKDSWRRGVGYHLSFLLENVAPLSPSQREKDVFSLSPDSHPGWGTGSKRMFPDVWRCLLWQRGRCMDVLASSCWGSPGQSELR